MGSFISSCHKAILEIDKVIDIEVKLKQNPDLATSDLAELVRQRKSYDKQSKQMIDKLSVKYFEQHK
jgi:hypothetical protein